MTDAPGSGGWLGWWRGGREEADDGGGGGVRAVDLRIVVVVFGGEAPPSILRCLAFPHHGLWFGFSRCGRGWRRWWSLCFPRLLKAPKALLSPRLLSAGSTTTPAPRLDGHDCHHHRPHQQLHSFTSSSSPSSNRPCPHHHPPRPPPPPALAPPPLPLQPQTPPTCSHSSRPRSTSLRYNAFHHYATSTSTTTARSPRTRRTARWRWRPTRAGSYRTSRMCLNVCFPRSSLGNRAAEKDGMFSRSTLADTVIYT